MSKYSKFRVAERNVVAAFVMVAILFCGIVLAVSICVLQSLAVGLSLLLVMLLQGVALWGVLLDSQNQIPDPDHAERNSREQLEIERAKREQMARERDAAVAATNQKSAFLTSMSHEIRTPMHAIVGMTELLKDSQLTKQQREYLDTIHYSADSLLTVINDILDLSRIETGLLRLEAVPFTIRERLAQTMSLLDFEAAQKNVVLVLNVHPEVPDAIIGDMIRLQQIIVNLVGNGIKFAFAGGGVVLQVLPEKIESDRVVLHFVVSDTGIGVPYEMQDRVFDGLAIGDPGFVRRFGGSGLGLAISSQLVKLLQGRIWLKSIPYRGSAFHFELAFKRAPEIQDPRSAVPVVRDNSPAVKASVEADGNKPATTSALRILLVEDHVVSQKVLLRLLENLGYQVTAADNGREAVERVQEQTFDLVLMDLQMPEMDGFTATAKIREMEKQSGNHLKIVALTANAMKDMEARCLAAGMDDYVSKPVKRNDLREAIERNLSGDPSQSAGE